MRRFAIAFIVSVALGWATPGAAQDPVSYWNERALAALAPGRGPTPAAIIDLAMVHLAMHDAVQAYQKKYEPFAEEIPGATGSSVVAAAKAARDILANRFPQLNNPPPPGVPVFDVAYTTFLESLSPPPSQADIEAGEKIGAEAARNVIVKRANDGSFPLTSNPFPPPAQSTAPGQWVPNAGTTSMVSPWGGDVVPFALDSLARCEVDPPPPLGSFEYALNFIEVKLFGSFDSKYRSPKQTAIGKTFSGNFIAQYNRLFRELAAAHLAGDSLRRLGQRARLFALTNLAMSDAFICSWRAKVDFNLWRPVHAIHRANEDGNFLTKADPSWNSLFSNGNPAAAQHPNYPDYTSGANNLTGSATKMLRLFFGSDKAPEPFAIYAVGSTVPLTPGVDPDPRMYTKFSDVADDVVVARIYLGIHFRFADVEGRSQGERAARYAFDNVLRPLK